MEQKDCGCRACGADFDVNPHADVVLLENDNARTFGASPEERGRHLVSGRCTAPGCDSTQGLYPRT
jgi:hypothetical protein